MMMKENQTKTTAKPPLPSAGPTNSPSRKRLLAHSNPKHGGSTTPSPQSSLSSDSTSDQFRKKTRELPNLSDCHGCRMRINYTNPEDRLRTLDSVWRIVLLCKECIKRVESAEICPYCFDKTSELDCFRCRDCEKFVHKDCVVKYGRSPPWSYCHIDSQFSVCVDCWVPNFLTNSIRVYSGKRNRGKKVSDSRILANNNDLKLLEDMVKDADLAVEKKFEIVAKAKEDALKKAVAAKNAVAFANSVLGLVAKNNEIGEESKCLDDVELALQLHRAMNSSPRIAKNFCSVNLSCLGTRKKDSGFYGKIAVCADIKLNENHGRTVSEHLVCNSTNLKGKECQENDEIGMAVLKYYKRRDKQSQKLQPEVDRTQGVGNTTILFYSRRSHKRDRYLLKYRRRPMSSKAVSNGETRCLYDRLLLYNQTSAPTPRLPLNCSNELRTFSDSPRQSCAVIPQAFACESASTPEETGNKRRSSLKKSKPFIRGSNS